LQLTLDDLDVVRVGSGEPLLVLHGVTPMSAELPCMRLLSNDFEIIAPSHPGFGHSARPDDFDSMYDLVRLYLHVLGELPNTNVLGCSFGAWLAAELAVACATNMRRLVLVDAVGAKFGARDERDITHLFNTPPAELDQRAWHDPSARPRGPFGLGWQMHLESLSDDELVLLASCWDAICLYSFRPHLYNPRLAHWLDHIRVPTLVLWGASDGIVTPEYGRTYAAHIPGAQFELIEGAAHHPELEQPHAFVERVRAFLLR
jgi:pimeloyl-ACP methyl ester carboxylesterase